MTKTLNVTTNQEMFDKIWNHFITHRHARGWSPKTGCITFDPACPDRRCAASILVPLKELRERAEAGSGTVLYHNGFVIDRAKEQHLDHKLLSLIATAHDAAAFESTLTGRGSFRQMFARELRNIAKNHRLDVPNDSDRVPVRWPARLKKQRASESLRELAAAVPEANDWIQGTPT